MQIAFSTPRRLAHPRPGASQDHDQPPLTILAGPSSATNSIQSSTSRRHSTQDPVVAKGIADSVPVYVLRDSVPVYVLRISSGPKTRSCVEPIAARPY